MKNIIIITGHAHYASGLLSSFTMIMGPNPNFYAVDFDETKDIVVEYQTIMEQNKDSNILFFCDMLGGTPFKECAKLAHDNPNFKVLVGCNLGSLMESSFVMDKLTLNELATTIIEASKKHTVLFQEMEVKAQGESDGI